MDLSEAETIMKDIDLNDSPFIATALALNADGIWSLDHDFKRQKTVNVFDTKDFL